MKTKEYVGDGCYAEHDGYALILTTSDGLSETNRIALEPETFSAVLRFLGLPIVAKATEKGSAGE